MPVPISLPSPLFRPDVSRGRSPQGESWPFCAALQCDHPMFLYFRAFFPFLLQRKEACSASRHSVRISLSSFRLPPSPKDFNPSAAKITQVHPGDPSLSLRGIQCCETSVLPPPPDLIENIPYCALAWPSAFQWLASLLFSVEKLLWMHFRRRSLPSTIFTGFSPFHLCCY